MSGYVNRLQTIASSAILAEQVGARQRICWIPFALAPSPAEAVFSRPFCDEFVVSAPRAQDSWGLDVDRIPLYVNRSGSTISLRGADKGEQALMSELVRELHHGPARILAIVSGGTFFLEAPGFSLDDFLREKSAYYRALPFHPEIERAVLEARAAHPEPYLGLHLRYTDRSRQAPRDGTIRAALRHQAEATGISNVFIAADSASSRDLWVEECERLNLVPWFVNHSSMDRESPMSAHPALIDWKLLGKSTRLVYFTASSFAVEAAVMSGSWRESSGLGADRLRAASVAVRQYAEAGLRRLHGKSR
jgi:hypothetical protein